MLGFLGRELDLDQDVEGFGEFVEAAGELGGIDGLDDVEELAGAAAFVGLEVSDQVEAGAWKLTDERGLGFELLDVVFAELAEAEVVSGEDGGGGEDLGDGEEGDFAAAAAGAGASVRDAAFDGGEIFGEARMHCEAIIMGPVPFSRKAARATPAAELREELERFLAGCRRPVLIEPGEAPFSLAEASEYRLTERADCLLVEAWDEARNLARRVVRVEERKTARLTLEVSRFGGRKGTITLADSDRAQAAPALLRGTREVLKELLRRWLARQYPGWQAAEITTGMDLEHTLSPAYPRALLRRGTKRLAAMAAPAGGADAAMTFALIWMDYVRRRDRAEVDGLALFLPQGEEGNTLIRLPHLRVEAAVFRYGEDGLEEAVDASDRGNVATHVEPWREPPPEPANEAERWLRDVSLMPGVERVAAAPGEVSLRVNGLEFARYAGGALRYGIDRKQRARGVEEVEALARELERIRHADAPEAGHQWVRRNPEAWLESRVRADVRLLDADLLREPVYGQVPAFAGQERGLMDLLAISRAGRLAVIEVKAGEDPQLPLQALDYWIRVAHHAAAGDFGACGYFRGMEVRRETPRLLLVAPALGFHPTTETVLGYFGRHVEVERIGLGVEWQRTPRVVLRVEGARRPEWDSG